VGIVGFARVRDQQRLPAGVWLDGIIAGAGLAALGAALVFRPVLASATGGTVAVATELAYPIGDLLLAALVVGVLAVRGWRVDRTMGLLGAGFLLLSVADCLYAVEVANGSSTTTSMTNLFYFLAVTLLAFAAWQPEHERPQVALTSWSMVLVPGAFTVIALVVLLYDDLVQIDPLADSLAALTLFAALVRAGFAFRDLRSLAVARSQAMTDDLTSLPNRRLFMSRTRAAIAAARLTGGHMSVMILDLDNFKQLNDTLGHDAGDELLRLIGPRLVGAIRATDIVARLGGDEFGFLLDPAPDPLAIGLVAEKVLVALRAPFDVQGLSLRVTGSIGIASLAKHDDSVQELMKHADIAMYQAKTAHDGYAFYAPEQDTNSQDRLLIAGELATALERGGIVVHFQPKADARSGRITGAEALVRLQARDGRLIAPLEFLIAAEQAGLSRALTRRVLDLALDQAASWRDAGHELRVAVNTSVADLLDLGFPGEVAGALAARDLLPGALILEVTETSFLSDPDRIGAVLAGLEARGISLSLDDFGTGYSSLTHLKSLPIDEVKIDRSFVARMCDDATDAAIVQATIELSHKLGISVVAEGVEDKATWDSLRALGCELIQGYFVSPPVPAWRFEALLAVAAADRRVDALRGGSPAAAA
jgi:diguanylate cyclase (GGDEF)-like protein